MGYFLIRPASLGLMIQESQDFVKLTQTLLPELQPLSSTPSCEHAG